MKKKVQQTFSAMKWLLTQLWSIIFWDTKLGRVPSKNDKVYMKKGCLLKWSAELAKIGHISNYYRRSLVLLASVFQRLINQSLYQEILLLQKFSDISGKVLKPKKKSASNLRKKNWGRFLFFIFFQLGFRPWNFSVEKKSFHANLKIVN